jgi:Protein of unknown function (DUF2934)
MGTMMTQANSAGRDQRITEIAHKIWEEEGKPEGRSEDHWARATAIVDAEILATKPADKEPVAKKPIAKKTAPAKKKT